MENVYFQGALLGSSVSCPRTVVIKLLTLLFAQLSCSLSTLKTSHFGLWRLIPKHLLTCSRHCLLTSWASSANRWCYLEVYSQTTGLLFLLLWKLLLVIQVVSALWEGLLNQAILEWVAKHHWQEISHIKHLLWLNFHSAITVRSTKERFFLKIYHSMNKGNCEVLHKNKLGFQI